VAVELVVIEPFCISRLKNLIIDRATMSFVLWFISSGAPAVTFIDTVPEAFTLTPVPSKIPTVLDPQKKTFPESSTFNRSDPAVDSAMLSAAGKKMPVLVSPVVVIAGAETVPA
jgi:hypothetical protein